MTEELVDVEGAALWTKSTGAGPGMLLAHGGPGMCDNLGPVAGMISDLARVHRYDQRACGRSTGISSGQSNSSAVGDVDALRAHWGYESWVVGGHSWGASLVLFYAMAHPERVRAVVYMNGPGVVPPPSSPKARTRTERLTPSERVELARCEQLAAAGDKGAEAQLSRLMWKSDFSDAAKVPDLLREPLFEFPRNAVVAKALRASREEHSRNGLADRVRQVDVPVLVLHGDDDPLPVECAEDLAKRLPRADLVVLAGVGHDPWLEDPDATRAALRAFLAELPG